MDPLSLTASLIAIGQGARAGLDVIKRVQAIWKAPQEIEALRLKLQELDETLNDILSLVSKSNRVSFGSGLAQSVARAKGIVARVNDLLQPETLNQLHLSNANKARFNFMRNSNKAQSLVNDLQVVRTDLCVQFGLVNAFVPCLHIPDALLPVCDSILTLI